MVAAATGAAPGARQSARRAGGGGTGSGRARRAAGRQATAPAHRPEPPAEITRSALPGAWRAHLRARHPAHHGRGALPGVPADPVVPRRRAGVADPAGSADRRLGAGRVRGRRDGPAPPADGGAGADGRLQRRAGGERGPGHVAVAAVRPPGVGGGVQRGGRRGASAIVPNLVRRAEVSTANAMFQALFQTGWWWARRWPACCWPGPGSASCTGRTWPASGRPWSWCS